MSENFIGSNGWSAVSRALRTSRVFIGAGVVGLLAACSPETVTSPVIHRADGGLGKVLGLATVPISSVKGLTRDSPLTGQPITVSRTFTANGGQLDIPEAGFSLVVPANAIPGASLTISVTANNGKMVAYEFEPHGTQFLKPLTIQQSLIGTSALVNGLLFTSLAGGYFKSTSQLNPVSGTAVVDETIPIALTGLTASFDIWHFSGYMVSTGRASEDF